MSSELKDDVNQINYDRLVRSFTAADVQKAIDTLISVIYINQQLPLFEELEDE